MVSRQSSPRGDAVSAPLSFTIHGLVLTLHMLRESHPTLCLIQIMEQDRETCIAALRTLQRQGCARYDKERDRWQGIPGEALDQAAHKARAALARATFPFTVALLHLERCDNEDATGKGILEGCDALLHVARHHLRAGHSGALLTCLDMLMHHLRLWRAEGQDQAALRHYMQLIRCTQGLSMYLCKRVDTALELLPKARQAAHLLGDKRVLLTLDLAEASQRHLTFSHNTEPPRALLARTLEAIQSLGDRDILDSTAHVIGILHFMQAEFQNAIAYLRTGNASHFEQQFDYFEESRWRYIASAACGLGKSALALGAMLHCLREAQLTHRRLAARWFQVHLADDLLRMGKPEEALEHLDAVLACAEPDTETRLWNWAVRCLAYYHFQHGRIRTAHHLLYHSMLLSIRLDLPRPYYGFTWLFDMLWGFEDMGLPPIPGYALEQELGAALQGPNRQFQAAALRVRALQQEKSGVSPEMVAETARCSLQHAQAVGNPLEVARSTLILSRCQSSLGLHGEAARLHDEARATLARYTQYDCPPPRAGTRLLPDPVPYVPAPRKCLQNLQQGLENLPVWNNLEEHIQRLLNLVRDALEVERTAIFRRDDAHTLTCLGACNLSVLEVQSSFFAPLHHWLLTALTDGGKVATRLRTEDSAALCLALPIPQERPLLFFAQCHYLTERIEQQDMRLFEELGQILGLELRTALLLQKRMQETQRLAEERARMAAVHMDSVEMPYYGTSMGPILRQIDHVADTDASVLILGETGAGKEMLARRVHAYSGRSGPFVPVHPASTPESLFESEFFGHEKGAFTGAHRQKVGLFELADKGTLFIDELGEIPLSMQTKLLRVLQEKTLLRVGGTREIRSDFRLVSATNRDLLHMVRQGSFREDLYYRVAVMPLLLPPLRERPEDIVQLAQLFLERFARRYQRRVPPLGPQEQKQLCAYAWPGNIRELKSVMERTVILCDGHRLRLALETVPAPTLPPSPPPASAASPLPLPEFAADFAGTLPSMEELQIRYLRKVLQITRGKIDGPQGAAHILGMKRSTLYAKIRQYGLDAATLAYGKE